MGLTMGDDPFGPERSGSFDKGTAAHLKMSVDGKDTDVAWSHTGELRREGEPVRDLIAFYDRRVEVVVS